jgi:ribonucleotide monophosphatase NagD (HAD superfamily)
MQGKKLIFVTNNSTKSRKQYMKKFLDLGLSVTEVRTKEAKSPTHSLVIGKTRDVHRTDGGACRQERMMGYRLW